MAQLITFTVATHRVKRAQTRGSGDRFYHWVLLGVSDNFQEETHINTVAIFFKRKFGLKVAGYKVEG